ncbi:Rho GTPase-activating protein 44 [Exaiptasia diaphana]|nr:Rho GTPase-activating protein 44 [Exaiptasia diaphana]
MKTRVDESSLRPVFGCPLEEHLKAQNRTIAFVLEECLMYLHDGAIEEQGLFRMAGSAGRIRKLKAAFDYGLVDLAEYAVDVHAITGVVKLYLRELPDPLMTFALYEEWIKAASIQENGARLQAYWLLIEKLPKENKDNLRYLICFLAKLSEYSDVNKMTPSNIAIVIAPNIVYSKTNTSDSVHLHHTGLQSSIVESLIIQHKYFFPEGVDFFRSVPTSPLGSANSLHKQQKRSVTEFPSVTGGFFDEVVGIINSGSAEKETSNGLRSNSPIQHSKNNSSQASSTHVMSQSGTGEKKRQAPTPAQVKYMGSISPVATSPPFSIAKPTSQPPPPPNKPGTPSLAPKPDLKK